MSGLGKLGVLFVSLTCCPWDCTGVPFPQPTHWCCWSGRAQLPYLHHRQNPRRDRLWGGYVLKGIVLQGSNSWAGRGWQGQWYRELSIATSLPLQWGYQWFSPFPGSPVTIEIAARFLSSLTEIIFRLQHFCSSTPKPVCANYKWGFARQWFILYWSAVSFPHCGS